jgi:hypothetical protein
MIVGISLQTYFSIQHVQAAAYLACRATCLERRSTARSIPTLDVAIKGYASSSLFTTVAFLEALVNELFADAAKSDGGHLSSLEANTRGLIAELGQTESVERAPVMSKFDILLKAAALPPVSRDRNPGQDLSTAIRLRNELVHYKAEWLDIGTPGMARPGNFSDSKLAKQVQGRFNDRPGPKSSDSWLGGGCAAWALRCAIAYTDDAFGRLRVKPLYEHVRKSLAVAQSDA